MTRRRRPLLPEEWAARQRRQMSTGRGQANARPVKVSAARTRTQRATAGGLSGLVANTGGGSSASAWTTLQQTGTSFLNLGSFPTCEVLVPGVISASMVIFGVGISGGDTFEADIQFDGLSFAASLYTPTGTAATESTLWSKPVVMLSFAGIFFDVGDSFFPVCYVNGVEDSLAKVEIYASHAPAA